MSTFIRRQEVAHAVGAAGRVTRRVTDADLRITGVPGDTAEIVASFEISAGSDEEASRIFDAVKLRVDTGAGQLTVEQREENGPNPLLRLLGRRGGATLELEARVPPGAALRVESVSGDVSTRNLSGEQRYAAVSGDLVLVDAAGAVRLNTVSGDAVLRARAALSLRAETVSGDLGVSTPRFELLRATTVSGDVDLEGALRPGGEYRIETVSGDVAFAPVGAATFEVRGLSSDVSSDIDHRVEGRADRRRVIIGQGGPELVFSSMSGDFHVRRPRHLDRDSDAASDADRATAPVDEDQASVDELDILRALERGEIDVVEAARRLGRS
jgi:hypothetical protein